MSTLLAIESGRGAEAKRILSSNSTLRGVDYLVSPAKRRLDMVVAGALSVGALLPIAMLGAAVWLQDRHNPFLEMSRFNPATGKRIPIWKIRTMIPNAETLECRVIGEISLAEFKAADEDPRVTNLGKYLRKGSLDELPQLLLAFRGDLSLVGPRMFSDSEWQYHILPNTGKDPYKQLMDLLSSGMKFGVTGFYAVMGRSNLSLEERVELDGMYGLDANIIGDLRILARSVTSVLSTTGAY